MYPGADIFRAGEYGGNTDAEKLTKRSEALVIRIHLLHGCLVAFPNAVLPVYGGTLHRMAVAQWQWHMGNHCSSRWAGSTNDHLVASRDCCTKLGRSG